METRPRSTHRVHAAAIQGIEFSLRPRNWSSPTHAMVRPDPSLGTGSPGSLCASEGEHSVQQVKIRDDHRVAGQGGVDARRQDRGQLAKRGQYPFEVAEVDGDGLPKR